MENLEILWELNTPKIKKPPSGSPWMDLARLGVGRVGLGLAGSSSSFPGNGEQSTRNHPRRLLS